MATDAKLKNLESGVLRVTGRLVDASNATLYAVVDLAGQEMACIYKPKAGERPLWDFPDGCLAHREFAAYLVSEFLSLHVVPLTVLRDGPYGEGMAQEWITIDETIDLAEFFSTDHRVCERWHFLMQLLIIPIEKLGTFCLSIMKLFWGAIMVSPSTSKTNCVPCYGNGQVNI
jgi:hypothetical protein